MEEYSKIMTTFLTFINQIKIYHWQTTSYPRHKATDELHSELSDLVDKFIEVLTGRLIVETESSNKRILLTTDSIKLYNCTDAKGYQIIINIKKYLESDEFINVIKTSSELINIKEEMLAAINKTSYLFSLQ